MADTEDTDNGDQRTAGGKAPRGNSQQANKHVRGIISSPMHFAGYLAKTVKGAVSFGSPASTARPAGDVTVAQAAQMSFARDAGSQPVPPTASSADPHAAGGAVSIAAAGDGQELQQALVNRVWPYSDIVPEIARAWSPKKLQSLLKFLPQPFAAGASSGRAVVPLMLPQPTQATTAVACVTALVNSDSQGADGASGSDAWAPYLGLHMLMRGAPGAPLPRSWVQQRQTLQKAGGNGGSAATVVANGGDVPPGLTAGQRVRYAPYSSMQRPATGYSRPQQQTQPPQPLPLLSPAPPPANQTSFADALTAANTTPLASAAGRAGIAPSPWDQQQQSRQLGSTAVQTPRTGQYSRYNQPALTPGAANGAMQRILPSPRLTSGPGGSSLGSALKRARDSPPGSTSAAPLMSSGIKNLAEYKRQRQGYSTPARPLLPKTPRAEAIAAPPATVTETARRIMASLDYMAGQGGNYNNVAPLSAQPSPAGTPVGHPALSRLLAGDVGVTPPGAYASLAGLAGPAGSTPYPRASAHQQQYPPTPPTAPPPLERLQVPATPAPAMGRFPELSPAASVAAFVQATRKPGPSPSTIIFPPEPELAKPDDTPASPARAALSVTFAAPSPQTTRPSMPPATPAPPAVIPSSPITFSAPAFGAAATATPATANSTALFNGRGASRSEIASPPADFLEEVTPVYRFGGGTPDASDNEAVRAVASITERVDMNGRAESYDVPTFTFGRAAAPKAVAAAEAFPSVSHDAVEAGKKQLAMAAAVPLPDDDDEDEQPAPATAPLAPAPAQASPGGGAAGTTHGSVTATPAAAPPVTNGWGDSFLAASKAKLAAASDAAAEDLRKASGNAAAPARSTTVSAAAALFTPPASGAASTPAAPSATPAASSGGGWGAALLSANRAQLQAASDAVAKEVEDIKSGGGAAASGTGAPASGFFSPSPTGFNFATPTLGGFSFGQQPPATGGSTPGLQFGVPTSTAATPPSLLGLWAAGAAAKDAQAAENTPSVPAAAEALPSETVTSVTYGRLGTGSGGAAPGGAAAASTAGTPLEPAAPSVSSGHTPGFSFPAAAAPSASPAFTFGAPATASTGPQSSAATAVPPATAAAMIFGTAAPATQPSGASPGFSFGNNNLAAWSQTAAAAASSAAVPAAAAASPMSTLFGAPAASGFGLLPSVSAAAPSLPSWSLPTATPADGAAPSMFGAPPLTAASGTPPLSFGTPVTSAGPGGGFTFGGGAPAASSSNPFGSSAPSASGVASPFSGTTPSLLMGQPQQQQQQQPAAPSFFGASSTPAFGATAAPVGSSSPFGGDAMVFGAAPAAASPPMFGGSSPSTAFGGAMQAGAFPPQAQQQSTGIVFGGANMAGQGGFASATPMFGAGAAPAFGAGSFGQPPATAPVFSGGAADAGGGSGGGAAFTMGAAQEPAARARKHLRVKRH